MPPQFAAVEAELTLPECISRVEGKKGKPY
jgi:hypothetical protein